MIAYLRIAITGWVFCIAHPLCAQPDTMLFQRFTTTEGLPHNRVTDVQRDRRGFLWVSTAGGVSRFDGFQFVNYLGRAEDAPHWGSFGFIGLTIDSLGRIWTATDRDLFWYDERNDRFRQYPLPSAFNSGMTLLENPDGAFLWVYQSGTIWKINVATFHLDSVTTAKIPGSMHIPQLDPDQQRIWLGAFRRADTIQIYDIRKGTWQYLPFHRETRERTTFGYYQDNRGQIWVGSNNQLTRFDPKTKKWKLWSFKNKYGQDVSYVFLWPKLCTDSVIWLVCGAYLKCFDTRTEKLTRQYFGAHPIYGITSEPDGAIWIGTDEGLFGYTPKWPILRFEYLFRETFPEGLQGDGQMLHAPIPHQINPDWFWFIPFGHGILLYDWKNQRLVQHYFHHGAVKRPIEADVIAMYYLPKNRLWVFAGDGILALDEKSGKYEVITTDPKFHWVRSHANDPDGNLWFEKNGRFYRADSLKNTFAVVDLPFTSSLTAGVSGIRFDPHGRLWVVTDLEIVFYQPATGQYKRVQTDWSEISNTGKRVVRGFEVDSTGRVWISTLAGLLFCDPDRGIFKLYDHRHGFASGYGEDMAIDAGHNIWMSSRFGLFRFDPRQERFAEIRLPGVNTETTQSLGIVGGRVWLASEVGARCVLFDPTRFNPRPAPDPVITAFRVRGQACPFDRDSITQFPLQLEYTQNVLDFDFTAVEFEQPDLLQFEYRLDPFDPDWTTANKNRSVTYTNLEGGEYIFRVRSKNTWGSISEREALFKIRVIPPFYRALWFTGFCILALGAIFYAVFRYRELQRLDKERIRRGIARDLHDEVGSTLSSISILSEAALQGTDRNLKKSRLGNIGEKARTAMESMSDIVWTVNPQNDSMENVIERMTRFAVELLEPVGITLAITMDEKVNDLALPMEKRKEFYLIFKEAVNNCAKYSRAKNAWVSLLKEERFLHMEIRDDGVGFDMGGTDLPVEAGGEAMEKVGEPAFAKATEKVDEPAFAKATAGKGNGLKNMEARAKALGGILQIKSAPGQGTTIRLTIPFVT